MNTLRSTTSRQFRGWRFLHPDLDVSEEMAGLQLAPDGGIQMVEGNAAIRQAILLLLSTIPGERVMRPDYGCELYRLIYAPNDDTTAGLAIHYVRRALERWEPRIEIVELEVPHEGSMCGLPCILCLLPCADCMLAEGPRLLLACFCGLGALFGGSCAGNQEGLAALGASDALAASAIRHLQNGAALQVGANQRDSHEQGLSAMGTDPGIPGLHEIGSLMN